MPDLSQTPDGGSDRYDDLVRPFQIDPFALRGRLVRLGGTIDRIIGQHGYPDPIAALLGEAIVLAAILAGALKYEGVFTLQTKGDGVAKMMVADITSSGAVRGYVQFDQAALDALIAEGKADDQALLLGKGYLAFTVDQGEHTERYQGIVEMGEATLCDAVQHYFATSEQINVSLIAAVGRPPGLNGKPGPWRAGGMMIQRLPPEGGSEGIDSRLSFDGELAVEAQEEGWRRAVILMGSCRPDELIDPTLLTEGLLFRLFHEDGVRIYPVHPLDPQCRCSRGRIETILRQIPLDDLGDLKIDGKVVVTCEFCSTDYRFDDAEIAALQGQEN